MKKLNNWFKKFVICSVRLFLECSTLFVRKSLVLARMLLIIIDNDFTLTKSIPDNVLNVFFVIQLEAKWGVLSILFRHIGVPTWLLKNICELFAFLGVITPIDYSRFQTKSMI